MGISLTSTTHEALHLLYTGIPGFDGNRVLSFCSSTFFLHFIFIQLVPTLSTTALSALFVLYQSGYQTPLFLSSISSTVHE